MKKLPHIALILAVSSSLAHADVATTLPTTLATTVPTSKPATRSAKAKFPTPRELITQMQKAKADLAAKAQIAVIDLGAEGGYPERPARPAAIGLFGGGGGESFRELTTRIQKAGDDSSIRAVLLTMNQGTGLNLAQIQELRAELAALKKADKRTFVYADTYDTRSYLLASAATDVCLMEAGEIFMPGIGMEAMFYKGTLDKLGIKADFVQIGEYKGAEEPYTRDKPSEELAAEMDRLSKNLMDELVSGISASREITGDRVRKLMDGVLVNASRAKKSGLVDHLVDIDGVRELMKKELNDDINVQENYAGAAAPDLDFSNPFSILTAMSAKPQETQLPKVAVVYAQGTIIDGEDDGGNPLLGGGENVASEPMRRAFRMALRDDQVKAVVVRIDSPGGSALASEAMWQSMRRLAEKKPVVVSIGGMAASGGYYLASAGDTIYADPAAIVGSIGVVGGKMVLGGLYEKVGLTTTSFTQGKNADIYSSTTEWTEGQRKLIKGWMKTTYEQFTDRIMTTRGERIEDIDKVARGRIFTAREAKELGMIDALGGLDAAIVDAAKRAKLEKGKYDLRALPPPPTIQEMLGKRSTFSLVAPMGEWSAVLGMMPKDVRTSLGQTIQFGQLMQQRPVVLMSPFVISVK